jgi:cytidine deaminase
MSDRNRTAHDEATLLLVDEARRARARAHAPYSGFAVGAAVRSAEGRIFPGCNVEISSYGLTVCAERVALFAAYAAGVRDFDGMAVVGPGSGTRPTTPCGACRQVIWDLAGDIDIYLATPDGEIESRRASSLLPEPFGPEQLDDARAGAAPGGTHGAAPGGSE